MHCRQHLSRAAQAVSLLLPRLTPPVAPVRERRFVTAQAGSASSFTLDSASGVTIVSKAKTRNDQLRKTALAARRSMHPDDRAVASAAISAAVIRSHEFCAAKAIACYLPMYDELDPRSIIARAWRANKRVFCPVVTRDGEMIFRRLTPDSIVERGPFGIWEPIVGTTITPRDLDLVVTPLVVFDGMRHRIGMGGGYYDRCFAFLKRRQHWLRPKLVGVAFDCQKVEKIRPNPWDIRLYKVFSETS